MPVLCINRVRPRQSGRHFPDGIFKWISIKISLKFVADGPINNIPALVQIMAWRQQGAKPLSEPMMVRLPTHICVTRPQWVNSLKPGQNGLHFPDIFKCSFLNENIEIAIKISPKFAPKVPINSIPALVQVMAWLATSHYLNHWWLVYWCLYVTRPQWVNATFMFTNCIDMFCS